MITLVLIGTFMSACCAAAAGLIASTHNGSDAAEVLADLALDHSEPQS